MYGDSLQRIPGRKTSSHRRRIGISAIKQPASLIDRTIWHRYEMKYRISESRSAAIAQFIKPYLHLDYYCKSHPSRMYPLVSLYFDSKDLQLCRQSLEGQKNRFKLRIRSYSDEPDYPAFVEIKRRANTIIIKNRARIMRQDIPALFSGISVPAQEYEADEEMLRQFQFYAKTINAEPIVRIRYMRQAYEDDSENRVRVTFDRQLCYKITTTPDISLEGSGWRRHSFHGVILEIKFTGRYPAWLNRMARYFNLQQRSMSKYVVSVKQSCEAGHFLPYVSAYSL